MVEKKDPVVEALMGESQPANVPGETFELDAAQIPFATTGLDAPTIYADLIRGTAVVGDITKIALVEHKVDALTSQVMAVHVANIVVPTLQIRAWGTHFTKLADRMGVGVSDAE